MVKERRKTDQTEAGSSSSKNSCGFATLPEDLVTRVFLLLPVSCLVRVKWVCKSWLSIIESSNFIYRHIDCHHPENDTENKLVVFNLDNRFRFTGREFISVQDFQLSNNVDIRLNPDEKISEVNLIASFNGIVCLTHKLCVREVTQVGRVRNDEIDPISFDSIIVVSLWNPATKHVKILPPPLVADSSITKVGNYRIDYGFGFDVKTNDYKVVRVTVGGFSDNLLKSHVQVYSLCTDSWRVIDATVPLIIWIFSNSKRPSMNGIYYWYGRCSVSGNPAILSFDFSNEVFGTIPMFDEYRGNNLFTFLKEKLACINWVPYPSEEHDNDNYDCKVWVLEKCGVKESWTKLYTFVLELFVFPMGVSANGKMVLKKKLRNGRENLFLLDPAGQEFNGITSEGIISEAAVYKESLVSLKGANGETYSVDNKWPSSSTWDRTVSQWIMGSHDRFAGILHDEAGGLVIFNEPRIAPRLPVQPPPKSWWAPWAGTIKLNTDAIMDGSSGLGTFGFVARNSSSIAVKAVCSNPIPMVCIFTGKSEAIKNALLGALQAGWDSIVIESDCKKVVDSIKGSIVKGSSDRGSSFSSCVTDINTLSTRFRSVSFRSVPRGISTAAQTLACHGFTCDKPCIWDDLMPGWLNDVLAKDLGRRVVEDYGWSDLLSDVLARDLGLPGARDLGGWPC